VSKLEIKSKELVKHKFFIFLKKSAPNVETDLYVESGY